MCGIPCRLALAVINGVFLVISLITVVVGALFAWGQSFVKQRVEEAVAPIAEMAGGDAQKTANEAMVIIMGIGRPTGLIVFFFGLIVFGITIFGCVGAACNNKLFLEIYAALIGIVILIHIIILIVHFMRGEKNVGYEKKLLSQFVDQYESLQSGRPEDIILSFIMTRFQCCGYDSGNDFVISRKFQKIDKYGNQQFTDLKYPLFCCKTKEGSMLKLDDCPMTFTRQNSNVDVGCAKLVGDKLLRMVNMVAYISIVFLLFNMALLVLAVLAIVL